MITRTEFQKIVKLDGSFRGSDLRTDAAYVESISGSNGLDDVEAAFKRLGYPLEYQNIDNLSWYPICLRVLSLRMIEDVLRLDEAGMKKMGDAAPKFSFLVRTGMVSPGDHSAIRETIPLYWRLHYSVGEMSVNGSDDRKGSLIVRLERFNVHPVLCAYLEGCLRRLIQFGLPGEKVESAETGCYSKGDAFHEYRFSWK